MCSIGLCTCVCVLNQHESDPVCMTLVLCVQKPTAACFTSAAVWMLYSNENEASPEQGLLQESGLSVLTVSPEHSYPYLMTTVIEHIKSNVRFIYFGRKRVL